MASASARGPLEGVAADDRAIAAAVADGAGLVIDAVEILGRAAGEDDDAPAGEARLHDMGDALGQRADLDLLLLIDLLRLGLLEMGRRRLHLDDMGAEQGGHMRGIGGDVDGGLALLRDAAARIGPDDDGEAAILGLLGELADLLHLVEGRIGAGIDGEADGRAAQPQRVAAPSR